MEYLVSLVSAQLKFTGFILYNPHHIKIPKGVSAAIGPNGAGKTSLARVLEGGWNYMTNEITSVSGKKLTIMHVEFSDIHSLSMGKGEYYQQRFESTMNDEIPTVAEVLGSRINSPQWDSISQTLGIGYLANKHLNYLSSGELRKMLIANIMFETPDLLILDNPYIGLDAASRQVLNQAIESMGKKGVSVLLLISNPSEIPDFLTVGIPIKDMTLQQPIMRASDMAAEDFRHQFDYLFDFSGIDYENSKPKKIGESPEIVKLSHCQVKYGKNVLLDDVSWSIREGECWSLSGPNGAGKSTLLSLINADNPQSYSNDICLFGRRRGTGESIWDIKSRIGYISPERHLYFNSFNSTALEVVAGGLKEAINQFSPLTDEQKRKGKEWLERLRISHLAERKFASLSFGEQRLALLARILIKEASLLILDEPLHGLDAANKLLVNSLINSIASQPRTTLIYVTHYQEEIPRCITHSKTLTPK